MILCTCVRVLCTGEFCSGCICNWTVCVLFFQYLHFSVPERGDLEAGTGSGDRQMILCRCTSECFFFSRDILVRAFHEAFHTRTMMVCVL